MRATLALPPSVAILEAALEGLVSANVVLMEAGKVPLSPLGTHVRYKREASGFEEWNIATRVLKLGYGDCEDLAAWQAAGHIVDGTDEGARVAIMRSGHKSFHAVCQLSNGEIEDVCPELGMRSHRQSHGVPGGQHLVLGADAKNTSLPEALEAVNRSNIDKLVDAAKGAIALPGNVKEQIRKEAKAGVTPIVMVAIGLSLIALTKRR